MSIEKKMDELIAALERNTEAHMAKGVDSSERVKDRGRDSDEPEAKSVPEKAPSRRAKAAEKDHDISKDIPSEKEMKEVTAAFLDLPSTADGDEEYEKRLATVFDPIFKEAKVKELSDLPEKYWRSVLDAITEYENKAKSSDTPRRRR